MQSGQPELVGQLYGTLVERPEAIWTGCEASSLVKSVVHHIATRSMCKKELVKRLNQVGAQTHVLRLALSG